MHIKYKLSKHSTALSLLVRGWARECLHGTGTAEPLSALSMAIRRQTGNPGECQLTAGTVVSGWRWCDLVAKHTTASNSCELGTAPMQAYSTKRSAAIKANNSKTHLPARFQPERCKLSHLGELNRDKLNNNQSMCQLCVILAQSSSCFYCREDWSLIDAQLVKPLLILLPVILKWILVCLLIWTILAGAVIGYC